MAARWLIRKKEWWQTSLLSRDWHATVRGQILKNYTPLLFEKSFTTVMIYHKRYLAVVKGFSGVSRYKPRQKNLSFTALKYPPY